MHTSLGRLIILRKLITCSQNVDAGHNLLVYWDDNYNQQSFRVVPIDGMIVQMRTASGPRTGNLKGSGQTNLTRNLQIQATRPADF